MVDDGIGELTAIAAAGVSRKEGTRLLKQLRTELANPRGGTARAFGAHPAHLTRVTMRIWLYR